MKSYIINLVWRSDPYIYVRVWRQIGSTPATGVICVTPPLSKLTNQSKGQASNRLQITPVAVVEPIFVSRLSPTNTTQWPDILANICATGRFTKKVDCRNDACLTLLLPEYLVPMIYLYYTKNAGQSGSFEYIIISQLLILGEILHTTIGTPRQTDSYEYFSYFHSIYK